MSYGPTIFLHLTFYIVYSKYTFERFVQSRAYASTQIIQLQVGIAIGRFSNPEFRGLP